MEGMVLPLNPGRILRIVVMVALWGLLVILY
jgi:hypothetical protein